MAIEKRGPNTWRIGHQIMIDGQYQWVRDTLHLDPRLSDAQQRKIAERALRQLQIDVDAGRAIPSARLTVQTMFDIWMEKHVDARLSLVTAANYRHLFELRILPEIGDVPLNQLTPIMIEDLMNKIRNDRRQSTALPPEMRKHKPSQDEIDAWRMHQNAPQPLSARTLRSYYDVLRYMLSKAVQWQMLPYNPMDRVDRPRGRRKPIKYLTDDQAVDLLRKLADEPDMSFRCAVLLALTCGLRLGEVGALKLKDVNWDKCTIDISRALKYTPRTGNFEDIPKSESSEREIELPPAIMALLDETRRYQADILQKIGNAWHGEGWIVCGWDGHRLHHDTPSKQFRKFADRNGFTGITFHALRHTHATLLFANNVDAVAVASRLGHADASTTLRIYAHALRSRDHVSARVMQNLISRAMAPDAPEPPNPPDK